MRKLISGLLILGCATATFATDADPFAAYYDSTFELRRPEETIWLYVNADGTWDGIFAGSFVAGKNWHAENDRTCFFNPPTGKGPDEHGICFRGLASRKKEETWTAVVEGREKVWEAKLYQGRSVPPAATAAQSPARGATEKNQDLLAQANGAYVLPGSESFTVKSSKGRAYRIFVWTPDGAAPANGFPVLMTLDANVYFPAAVSALQVMAPTNPAFQMKSSVVRPMMVVGIGYPGSDSFAKERAFDYLPVLTTHGTTLPQEGWPGQPPGGADQFLSFLLDELRPALARRYHIDPEHQTLMGHSLGGFFTLFAFSRRPDAFRNYVAVSPSLWWDEHRLVNEADKAPRFAAQGPAHHVLLAVAHDEEPGIGQVSEIMRNDGRAMAANLKRQSNDRLDVRYVEVPDEDHQSMQIAMMAAALRTASQ